MGNRKPKSMATRKAVAKIARPVFSEKARPKAVASSFEEDVQDSDSDSGSDQDEPAPKPIAKHRKVPKPAAVSKLALVDDSCDNLSSHEKRKAKQLAGDQREKAERAFIFGKDGLNLPDDAQKGVFSKKVVGYLAAKGKPLTKTKKKHPQRRMAQHGHCYSAEVWTGISKHAF